MDIRDYVLGFKNIEELKTKIKDGIDKNRRCDHKEYNFMLDQLWVIFFETTRVLRNCVVMRSVAMSDKEHTIFSICRNCLLDSHAALNSLSLGFDRAAALAMRGVLENLSLAIVMKDDESDDIYNQYVKGDYEPPRAVSAAKKIFRHLGKLYGQLSKSYAHEDYNVIGRSYRVNGETLGVPTIGRHDFLVESILLSELGYLVEVVGVVAEWNSSKAVKPSVFSELQSDGRLRVKRDTVALQANRMLDQCRKERLGGGLSERLDLLPDTEDWEPLKS